MHWWRWGSRHELSILSRGKRGGIRVFYYARLHSGAIWILIIYAKNEAENIAPHILRRIREEIDG